MSYLILQQTNDSTVVNFNEIMSVTSSAMVSRRLVIKRKPSDGVSQEDVTLRDDFWTNRDKLKDWMCDLNRQPIVLIAEFNMEK